VVGNRTRVKVVKNKMAPPFREVEFDILYGQGIRRAGDVIDLATEANIVEKSGAWFSFQGERIGQGRENARTYLEQHPAVLDKIEALVLSKFGISRGGPADAQKPAAKAPEASGNHAKAKEAAPPAAEAKRAPAKANQPATRACVST
jgi:recombination protein RecA